MDQFSIGAFRVHRIEEWRGPFLAPRQLFGPADGFPATEDSYLDGPPIEAFIQSWIVKTPTRTILLDTGCGNHKNRPGIPIFSDLSTDFLGRMAAVGFLPEDVDLVVCTHLHVDHVS